MSTFRQVERHAVREYPSGRWRSLMFRSPVLLWRLGLAEVVGRYVVLLSYTEQYTGEIRHIALEFHHDRRGNKYIVSAFGEHADWYNDIMANPHVTVHSAWGVQPQMAYRVTDERELAKVYHLFKRYNPVMTRWYTESLGMDSHARDVIRNKHLVHFIGFTSTKAKTPSTVHADLRWLTGLFLGVIAAVLAYLLIHD